MYPTTDFRPKAVQVVALVVGQVLFIVRPSFWERHGGGLRAHEDNGTHRCLTRLVRDEDFIGQWCLTT
jgi:hypothetical protein